jgi:hypothetical protein
MALAQYLGAGFLCAAAIYATLAAVTHQRGETYAMEGETIASLASVCGVVALLLIVLGGEG